MRHALCLWPLSCSDTLENRASTASPLGRQGQGTEQTGMPARQGRQQAAVPFQFRNHSNSIPVPPFRPSFLYPPSLPFLIIPGLFHSIYSKWFILFHIWRSGASPWAFFSGVAGLSHFWHFVHFLSEHACFCISLFSITPFLSKTAFPFCLLSPTLPCLPSPYLLPTLYSNFSGTFLPPPKTLFYITFLGKHFVSFFSFWGNSHSLPFLPILILLLDLTLRQNIHCFFNFML